MNAKATNKLLCIALGKMKYLKHLSQWHGYFTTCEALVLIGDKWIPDMTKGQFEYLVLQLKKEKKEGHSYCGIRHHIYFKKQGIHQLDPVDNLSKT